MKPFIALLISFVVLLVSESHTAAAWVSPSHNNIIKTRPVLWSGASSGFRTSLAASVEEKKDTVTPEETTEKFGLEAGIFQSLKQKDGGESAKSLLKRYGIAYLATSIPLALISFAICFVLVDNGVDVAGLLAKVGIENSDAGEKAGTFALAYAAHKAASPIRFPPTVILTPLVAKLIGKEPVEESDAADAE
jgi:Protein of unknown function (DUF1279)